MRKYFLLAAIFCFISTSLLAQTVNQNTGWFLFLNSTKFNDKWGMHFDLQVRSEDSWERVKNVLIRPGVTYYINKNANATLGYLYTTNKTLVWPYPPNSIMPAIAGPVLGTLTEHRIWQQYIYNHQPWKGTVLSHRFRLEQRFIERPIKGDDDVFSQRFRYFFRLVQPLQKQEDGFVGFTINQKIDKSLIYKAFKDYHS